MITLPPLLVPLKYPGYFWHLTRRELYSLKITGELRSLTKIYPNRFNKITEPGYRISHKGVRRFVPISDLNKLTEQDAQGIIDYVDE